MPAPGPWELRTPARPISPLRMSRGCPPGLVSAPSVFHKNVPGGGSWATDWAPCPWLRGLHPGFSGITAQSKFQGTPRSSPNSSRCSRASDPFLPCAGISLPGSIPFPPVKQVRSLGSSKGSVSPPSTCRCVREGGAGVG